MRLSRAYRRAKGRTVQSDYDEIKDVWDRMYAGSEETAGPASLRIVGVLGPDGAVIRPRVTVHLDDVLTAEEARELAALLIAQADEIDRLGAP